MAAISAGSSTNGLAKHMPPAYETAVTDGCAVDRVGPLRIVHVFDEFTPRTVRRLLDMIRSVAAESGGRLILSLLESREIDAFTLERALEELEGLRPRLTLVASAEICAGLPFAGRVDPLRCATTFGQAA